MIKNRTANTFFTINQVASLLHVSRQTINSYMKKGYLNYLKIGYTVRFTDRDLVNFAEKFRAATPS